MEWEYSVARASAEKSIEDIGYLVPMLMDQIRKGADNVCCIMYYF